MKQQNFQIFKYFLYKRLPNDFAVYEKRNIFITFLNPYTLAVMKKHEQIYLDFDYICSDGIVPVILERIFGYRTQRISFDLGSLAKELLGYAEKTGRTIYFCGTTSEHLTIAIKKIKALYPGIKIAGSKDGFFSDEQQTATEIISANPDIVILGMGVPKQDLFAVKLKKMHFQGSVYTCGGFLHQTAISEKGYYYPEWINRFNLRTFYRILHEKYILKRVLIYYFPFLFSYSYFLLSQRFKDFVSSSKNAVDPENWTT